MTSSQPMKMTICSRPSDGTELNASTGLAE